MIFSASKQITHSIKETREWLAERPPIIEQELEFLNEDLSEGTLQGLKVATVTLGVLATYYGSKGVIGVVDGDRAAWDDIHRSLAYHFWCLKIQSMVFFKTAFLRPIHPVSGIGNEISIAGCLYCYYLASGSEERQHYTIDVLKGIATIPGAVPPKFWAERIFEPFVLRLHQKQESIDLPDALLQRDLGPYGKILDYWDTPERLADAIRDVCDYHCSNMEDTGDDWDPEFDQPPFDLLPCEILGIYAMRQKMELETPKVDHPLLEFPLANLEPDLRLGKDEVLSRVENVYLDVFYDS
jgi:hypothetical protein